MKEPIGKPSLTLSRRMKNAWLRLQRDYRIFSLNRQVSQKSNPQSGLEKVVIFNASTRLGGFSQNAAFSLLTSWGLRLAGIPVHHVFCNAGMTRCVLGTNPDDPLELPPCHVCVSQSKRLVRFSEAHWIDEKSDPTLQASLEGLSIDALSHFEWEFDPSDSTIQKESVPLGSMVLPSLRWALRRHHFPDNESTRFLLKSYIQSAFRVLVALDEIISNVRPGILILFNGTMFPEAAARWIGLKHGLRVLTHEVGFQPFSAFFTDGQATAYPMDIPENFQLNAKQEHRLDTYLSQRFQGDFTMAGIRFWPKISVLGDDFLRRAEGFRQIVPVFTNVINDTSQVHACSVFKHMYDWLESVASVIVNNPETLFIIRAHPDEKRRGTKKHSRQPVSDWVEQKQLYKFPNVIFIDSNEPLSSYELIRKSKFVIVYNSSIGLEAALLGVPVLCGGKARYTQIPTVFFPQTREAYKEMVEGFLKQDHIDVPLIFKKNARRILYWQLFRTALPFGRFLHPHPTPGYVQLRRFSYKDLLKENSPTIRILVDGIMHAKPFIVSE